MDLHGDGLAIEQGIENNKPTAAIAKRNNRKGEKNKKKLYGNSNERNIWIRTSCFFLVAKGMDGMTAAS